MFPVCPQCLFPCYVFCLLSLFFFGAFAYHPHSLRLVLIFFVRLLNLILLFLRDCVSFGELSVCFASGIFRVMFLSAFAFLCFEAYQSCDSYSISDLIFFCLCRVGVFYFSGGFSSFCFGYSRCFLLCDCFCGCVVVWAACCSF